MGSDEGSQDYAIVFKTILDISVARMINFDVMHGVCNISVPFTKSLQLKSCLSTENNVTPPKIIF